MTPFEHLILDVLDNGPLTGFEIARAVERAIPGALVGREGYIYPAILALERRNDVFATWEHRDHGRRRVYRRGLIEKSEDLDGGS
jgi:PadR family transcriptional regulator